MEIVIIVGVLIALIAIFDLAAVRFGQDTREGLGSGSSGHLQGGSF